MESTDEEFLRAFHSGTIESFRHADHIRLAWLYHERFGMPEAETQIAAAILRFATAAGQSEKYHHTITIAWMRLVAFARLKSPNRFDHPELFDKNLLSRFYSPERLASPAARSSWLEPDLRPFASTDAASA